MASTGDKRPHPEDDGLENGNKRPKSNNASPAPATSGAKPSIQEQIAAAKARAAAVKARLAAGRSDAPSSSPVPSPSPAAAPQSQADAIRARTEAMKARIAAAKDIANKGSTPQPTFKPPQRHDDDDAFSRARGGLGIGLHPALLADSIQDTTKSKQNLGSKFATTMGNRRTESPLQGKGKEKKQLDLSGPTAEELKKNPYYDPNVGPAVAKPRQTRELVFNQKGKYIQQANALRRQAALEAMKKRIAESARKAGLDEDNEKGFLVPAPPAVEWWDEGLLSDTSSYDSDPKIDTEDTIVTRYIQHPVLLEAPQDKLMPTPKPMHLTTKEQKKIRRVRRMVALQEQQAKVRLGLEPAEPPKLKPSNYMRVMGEQAIANPSAVEAMVSKQVRDRHSNHVQANEERALTKEQKAEKLARQQEADAARGIFCVVYRIDNLSYGKHRYQIDIAAKQNAVTGITILHPRLNLVIVEGGHRSIELYKKAMNRVKWTENDQPNAVKEGNREAEEAWLKNVTDEGELKDLSFNRCQTVWEGQERQRSFRRWTSKVCETDGDVKETLMKNKMENMWVLAKSMP